MNHRRSMPTIQPSPTKLDRMEITHDVAERAAIGCIIKCPNCNHRFEKRTRWHLFCTPDCKYTYQNLILSQIPSS